jgi:DNA-binding transcriptional MerR regulator
MGMPKRIIIKDSDLEEAEPVIEPVEEAEKPAEAPIEAEIEEAEIAERKEDVMLEKAIADADAAYELVLGKIDEIRVREEVTQKKFLDDPGMSLAILKKLIQRWDSMREELTRYIDDAIERYRKLAELLEERFSSIEEEVYFNQVELDTIMQLESQGKPISVSKKEELERLIPRLREELAQLDKKIKEVNGRIEELRRMRENIYEATSYKGLVDNIFTQIVNSLQTKYESPEDAAVKIRSQVEIIAQREGIPREYATLYLWKRLKGQLKTG